MLLEQELAVKEETKVPPDGLGSKRGSSSEGSKPQINRERRSRPGTREVEDLGLVVFKYET
jgi:hypothetical protein